MREGRVNWVSGSGHASLAHGTKDIVHLQQMGWYPAVTGAYSRPICSDCPPPRPQRSTAAQRSDSTSTSYAASRTLKTRCGRPCERDVSGPYLVSSTHAKVPSVRARSVGGALGFQAICGHKPTFCGALRSPGKATCPATCPHPDPPNPSVHAASPSTSQVRWMDGAGHTRMTGAPPTR